MEECPRGEWPTWRRPRLATRSSLRYASTLRRQMEFLRVWKNHQAGKLRWISDASLAIVSAAIGGAIASLCHFDVPQRLRAEPCT